MSSSDMPYTVLTMFKIAADYRDDAISALKQMKEISLANGSQGVRIGMMQSGSNVGNFVAIVLRTWGRWRQCMMHRMRRQS